MTDPSGELVNLLITHVRYAKGRPRLVDAARLLARGDLDFEDRGPVTRDDLVALLEDDQRIFTWDWDAEDLGPELHVEYVDVDAHHLRVDGEEIAEDDLGDLPPLEPS